MNINLTLLGQAISFAFFVIFCMKYVWPPLVGALRERREKIEESLAAAEKGAQAREEAEAEVATMLQDAKAQAAEIVANAQKRGNEIIEEAQTNARAEGDRIIATAKSEIEQETASAKDGLRKQVGGLAVEGARKILGKEVDESAHANVIDELIGQI